MQILSACCGLFHNPSIDNNYCKRNYYSKKQAIDYAILIPSPKYSHFKCIRSIHVHHYPCICLLSAFSVFPVYIYNYILITVATICTNKERRWIGCWTLAKSNDGMVSFGVGRGTNNLWIIVQIDS